MLIDRFILIVRSQFTCICGSIFIYKKISQISIFNLVQAPFLHLGQPDRDSNKKFWPVLSRISSTPAPDTETETIYLLTKIFEKE
jgi:hypothetical protein